MVEEVVGVMVMGIVTGAIKGTQQTVVPNQCLFQ